MIHHFEAIEACFDNLVNQTVFWQNIGGALLLEKARLYSARKHGGVVDA